MNSHNSSAVMPTGTNPTRSETKSVLPTTVVEFTNGPDRSINTVKATLIHHINTKTLLSLALCDNRCINPDCGIKIASFVYHIFELQIGIIEIEAA
jgi:hypothetical protein